MNGDAEERGFVLNTSSSSEIAFQVFDPPDLTALDTHDEPSNSASDAVDTEDDMPAGPSTFEVPSAGPVTRAAREMRRKLRCGA